jgi:hypothetical protein
MSWWIGGGKAPRGGQFVFLGYGLFFQPKFGTIILLDSSFVAHYIALVLDNID